MGVVAHASRTRLEDLGGSLNHGRLLTDPDVVESYRLDRASWESTGSPLAVVIAADAGDVVATLRWASEHRVPVVPRGSGTSLAGGASAIEGCIVLSLASMDRIVELAPAERLAVVEPGVITADLDRAARAHGLMYAPDPSSYAICTIGGNLATNAGGLRCLKYGVTRDSALGLEVVLASGSLIRTGRRTAKGVTGYDLTGLFIGSEGTLGVITSAVVRLRPAPRTPPVTVAATFGALPAAVEAASMLTREGVDLALLELMDRTTLAAIEDWKHTGIGSNAAAMLIAQADGPLPDAAASRVGAVCEQAGATDVAVATNEFESDQLIELRRLAYPATERLGACLVEDVCVPVPRLTALITRIEEIGAAHRVTIATVAHAGDGNVHPVFVYDRALKEPPAQVWAAADDVFGAALALGGTLTGEHGVGAIKTKWIGAELGAESHVAHRTVKAAFDPLGILNPGRAI